MALLQIPLSRAYYPASGAVFSIHLENVGQQGATCNHFGGSGHVGEGRAHMDSPLAERWFRVCAPSVVSEVIDGEAVILDLRSGHYYSARDSGALVWAWIGRGCSDRQVLEQVATHFAVETATAAPAVAGFIDTLLAHDLVRPAPPGPAAPADPAPADPAPGERATFIAPALSVYTDMQDLLLLDPIHDVDEIGWPTRRDGAAG